MMGDTARLNLLDQIAMDIIELKRRAKDQTLTEEERESARRQLKRFENEATKKIDVVKNGHKPKGDK